MAVKVQWYAQHLVNRTGHPYKDGLVYFEDGAEVFISNRYKISQWLDEQQFF